MVTQFRVQENRSRHITRIPLLSIQVRIDHAGECIMRREQWLALLLVLLLIGSFVGCGGGGGGNEPVQQVPCVAPVQIDTDSFTAAALTTSDCSVRTLFPDAAPNDQSLLDQYIVTLPIGGELTIRMESAQLDSYLALLNSQLDLPPIAEDDDSGGGLDAMIITDLSAGTYVIIANSATQTAVTGDYTLTTTFAPHIWSAVSMVGAPEERRDHTAVWSGSEMIIWGGDDGNSIAKNSGGRYDPATDAWTPTATLGAPSARSQHTAVWTGSEMIVWGGFTGAFAFDTLGDGARYDPQTDTWTPMSSTNQPSPRVGHTAVWTGSEMIVWGGFSCVACANAELGTGARYDPSTDTWTPIPTNNAPEARGSHTAVWTGTEMIVWGGETERGVASLTLLDSGGSYDPTTDSWTTTADAGAPPTRCHEAVWTGADMIIFGGQTTAGLACGMSSVNTGRRYEPSTDTWSLMSDAPLASSLAGPVAIWSGDRMIAWFDDSGGRYEPITDVWENVSADSAPSARRGHSLVWTGTQMIVWGGQFAGPLNSGAVYNPHYDSTP
jgi:N-acetylneuraminic acid mutarotase